MCMAGHAAATLAGCLRLRGVQVGGMGDVVTALGRAVLEQGHAITAMLPKYDCLDYSQVREGPATAWHGGRTAMSSPPLLYPLE